MEEKFDVSAAPSSSVQGSTELEIKEAEGLLGRCANELNENAKPKLRIIHHLACSGGTLISKCLSALPNVYLLSEVHPHTSLALDVNKPRYSPTDISSLAKYANIPFANELADKILKTEFRNYHKKKAILRLVKKELNLSRAYQARIGKTKRDLTIE